MGDFRDGDWYCERCGDHQFERNLMCRKCATPKPMVSTNSQASKAGDWICPNPNCKDLQFERNAFCRRCSTPRPFGVAHQAPDRSSRSGGVSTYLALPSSPAAQAQAGCGNIGLGTGPGAATGVSFAPEDWICANCGDHQFAKNIACRLCRAPKPVPAARGANNQPQRPGDWNCPSCGDLQFERNQVCRKCGCPKPALPPPSLPPNRSQALPPPSLPPNRAQASPLTFAASGRGSEMATDDWICSNCGDHQFARNLACRKCAAPKPTMSTNNQVSKMGDWICPNPACRDVQFEKNHMCRRCSTPKPQVTQMAAGTQTRPLYGGHRGLPLYSASAGPVLYNSISAIRPGDWTCPNPQCKDIQFERNTSCRLCGTPRPPVASNRQVFKSGDWICPNPECKDVQFERNTNCRQCGTAKPDMDNPAEAAEAEAAAAAAMAAPKEESEDTGRSRSPVRGASDGI